MIRPFAGVLDPDRGTARATALRALPGCLPAAAAETVNAGALLLGAPGWVETEGVLCLIDGAVYNHAELGEELGLGGGESPEAVLARAYRRWGAGVAPKLRGEFSLLVWDRREQRGILVPDQIGIRRMVVRRDGRRLWFASEVRHLMPLLGSRPGPDPAAVSHWLTGRPAPQGATLYRGIERLAPGRMIVLERGGCAIRRYWQPRYREPLRLGRAELLERIREALARAVSRRATPGAPAGVLLSGGLDSTSVASLAQREEDGACGFSVVFPDYPRIDESAWIEALESRLGLPGVHLVARPEGGILASGLQHLAEWELPSRAFNEPWAQPLLRRAAGMGVGAMLSGEGGDELFGSRLMLTADLMRRGRLLAAARYARGLPEAGGRAPRDVLAHVLWRYGVQGAVPARLDALSRRLAGAEDAVPWWAGERMARLLEDGPGPSWRSADGPRWWAYLTHALTEGAHGFGLFDHVRRRTEQHGIEARHPLLDLDLFELMLRVPPLLCSEGELTRPLLREAMAGISPDAVRLRAGKSVFDDLVTDALLGPELPALRELLGNASEVRAYARAEAIDELLEEAPAPAAGRRRGLGGRRAAPRCGRALAAFPGRSRAAVAAAGRLAAGGARLPDRDPLRSRLVPF